LAQRSNPFNRSFNPNPNNNHNNENISGSKWATLTNGNIINEDKSTNNQTNNKTKKRSRDEEGEEEVGDYTIKTSKIYPNKTWKRHKPSRPPSAIEIFGPTDDVKNPGRTQTRTKQISYGKNTLSYDRYTELVPQDERTIKEPWTPDATANIPNKRWKGMVSSWRKALHKYDPEPVKGVGPDKDVPLYSTTPTSSTPAKASGKEKVADEEKERAKLLGLIVTQEDNEGDGNGGGQEGYEKNDEGDGWVDGEDSDSDDDDLL